MKKSIFKLFAIVLCCLFVGNITASAKDNAKAQEKAEKKQLKAMQDSLNFATAKNALENMYFVVKADQVSYKNGALNFVDNNTNYLSVQHDKAVLRVTSNNVTSGNDGISVEGAIATIKQKSDKKGNYYLEFDVAGLVISARISIMLPKGSNIADVTVYPNFNADTLDLFGIVYDYDKATVFESRTF